MRQRANNQHPLDTIITLLAWGLFLVGIILLPVIVIIVALGGPETFMSYVRLMDVLFLASIAGFPLLVALIVLIPALAIAMRNLRQRRSNAILEYLQQAFRLNLPIDRYLSAAALGESTPVALRIEALRAQLQSGAPLYHGLELSVPELPTRSIGLIEHAEKIGKVPQALDRLIEEHVAASRRLRQNSFLAVWYPPVLLLVMGAVIYILSMFIEPKFMDIAEDFNVPMPALSRWLLSPADWVQPASVALLFVLLIACGHRLREIFFPNRPNGMLDKAKAYLLWNLPLIHGIVYDHALADLCTALADSVESGRSLTQALLGAWQLQLHPVVEHRLDRWGQYMTAGMPIGEAARLAEFPELFCGMIAPEASGATLGEAMRFLARYYRERTLVRRAILRGMYLPIMTVVMGVCVATVALCVFLPLARFEQFLGGGF
jgi:type IV pilus assembly protein PilC